MSSVVAFETPYAELIKRAQSLEEKALQATDKAAQFYISLGQTLLELKRRKPKDITWPSLIVKHFRFGKRRADELIQIADGTKTVEQMRGRTRDAVQKYRDAARRYGENIQELRNSQKSAASSKARQQRKAKARFDNMHEYLSASERTAVVQREEVLDALATGEQVDRLIGDFSEFNKAYCASLRLFFEAHPDLDETAKVSLFHCIHIHCDRLMTLVQELDGRTARGE